MAFPLLYGKALPRYRRCTDPTRIPGAGVFPERRSALHRERAWAPSKNAPRIRGDRHLVGWHPELYGEKVNPDVGKANLSSGKANPDAGETNLSARKASPRVGKANLSTGKANSGAGKTNLTTGEANPRAGKTNLITG